MINIKTIATGIILGLSIHWGLNAQASLTAGPDKTVCPGVPTSIGPPTEVADFCYKWEPEDFLSCTNCANPEVTFPDTLIKKQYTLFITDEDLSFAFTDKMEVLTGFGPVDFDKTFFKIIVGEEVQLDLIKNEGDAQVNWGFVGDPLGCSIDANEKLMGCNKFGEVTVKATRVNDMNCSVEGSLEVNHGVKDVFVSDADNPKRVAKNGQTLVLLDNPNCVVEAIANDGEEFGAGSPEWFNSDGFGVVFPAGSKKNNHTAELLVDNSFTAGNPTDDGPTTYVDLRAPVTAAVNVGGLITFFQGLMDIAKEVSEFSETAPPPAPQLLFTASIENTALSTTTVEDFDSHESAFKYDAIIGLKLTISGKVFHPVFTKTIAAFGTEFFSTELGMGSNASGSLTGTLTKDPSKEDDGWTGSASAAIGIGFDVFLGVTTVLGPNYVVNGGFSLPATATITATYASTDPENIPVNLVTGGLAPNFSIKIEKVTDPRKTSFLIGPITYQLIKPSTLELGKINLPTYFGQ